MEEIHDIIQKKIRSDQQQRRESLLNKSRNITIEYSEKLNKEDLIKIANQLKKKKVNAKQLAKLKESFLQDKDNINMFLNVDGVLEALVKALSGQNAKLQINAAYCLCNLSLSDKCLKIIRVAGPYLLIHLEGMNTYLIEACTWALGNLSSHDEECVKALKQQGAIPLLVGLLSQKDENIIVAAAYTLSHFVYSGFDLLKPNDFRELMGPVISLFKKKNSSVVYLMSLLSAKQNCQVKLLQEGIHIESLNMLLYLLKKNILHCSWYIRIIANLVNETTGQATVDILTHTGSQPDQSEKNMFDAIEYIIGSGQIFLVKECCWLLGNILKHQNEEIQILIYRSKIFEKLEKPVRYFLLGQPKNEENV